MHKQHLIRTFTLAYPVVLSQLGHVLVGVADSLMVGQLGVVPLAAISLSNSLFTLTLVVGLGVSFGLTPLVAAADGRHHAEQNGSLLTNSLLLNGAVGLLLGAGLSLATPLLWHLGQPPDVAQAAEPYLLTVLWSLVPLMVFQTFRQFAEGLSDTRAAMLISVAANGLNVLLNWLLIFGHGGLPALGMLGAGLATLLSRVVMAALMAAYVVRSPKFAPYRLQLARVSRRVTGHLLRVGVPIAMQMFFQVGAFSAAALVVGRLGANQVGAHQIAISLASVTYMMASGLGAAATVRVGNQWGARNRAELRRAGTSAFVLVGLFMSVAAAVFIAAHRVLPALYIDNGEVMAVAGQLIIIAAFFQLSDGVQVVALGALRGMADVRMPTLITFVAYWVIGLPVGGWLSQHLGAAGIWWGLLVGLSSAALLLTVRFYSAVRRMKPVAATVP